VKIFVRQFVLVLMLAAPLAAGPIEDAQVEALYDQALQAFQSGKGEVAVVLLEQAQNL
jgi:hypothetical protein